MRGWIGLMTLTSALLAAYEAVLFAIMGRVVDWLGTVSPANFWAEQQATVLGIAAILLGSVALLALHTTVMHQVLAINFPMRLRWVFHKLMLGQSMSFYADEFAGRITTKIMQTALSVREVVFMVVDVFVGVGVYMIGILILAASFEWRLMIPFALWFVAYAGACFYFVPRLGQIGKEQADARSMMTGRVTDAYTNIATVKLFAHTRREAEYARNAMEAFKATGYAQMRLVSLFEITNHLMIALLLLGSGGTALYLWTQAQASAGVVAAVIAMALRLMGYSHWVMWQMTGLFENVGTIQDGITTLTKPRTIVDAPDAKPLQVTRGAIAFEDVSFGYKAGGKRCWTT
jgi:ATP-binding cassette subfamily B multidrug efflux pump